jgi:hypothetical protein
VGDSLREEMSTETIGKKSQKEEHLILQMLSEGNVSYGVSYNSGSVKYLKQSVIVI